MQAKVLKSASRRLSKKEKVQFDLLLEWPPFNFIEAARYDTVRVRDFAAAGTSANPQLSGEYGWIGVAATPTMWDQFLTVVGAGFSGRAPLARSW